ncbi:hypothetical protein CC85DRAFT_309926 [Cutaneotrichosporon oleaginosum]|uniref:Uncharacterized protein n=1 Tax=Cutaneotrichosporon oleaginosum TaxID=879819 RepID=A0A0J0XB82_9TREE|nr:uncharacterized protein CC85DRAFT_309926 [Cutaneotrichosporon oleaginosum]KLT38372.1 hypothetical protein CC85DRAFT_309926 [Cutaneotrichosporon oleaginosum]TXT07050.1 hypothetical protein COLE_06381 [Cutaneotrichosporon oleaginosum]
MSQDARFARLQTDPRFRRPKQKALKTEIDERFKDALSADFGKVASKAKVDKRGRPVVSTAGEDSMKRFYRLTSPDEARVDYARGEGVLESSGSEDEDSEVEEDELELGGKRKMRYLPESSSDSEEESHGEDGLVDLSESDDEGRPRINLSEDDEPDMQEDEEEEEEEGAEPTTRIAAVNLDWDHLRAADIFTIFNSFLKPPVKKGEAAPPPPGRLLSVRIYPSEFGKERMAAEDAAGPGGGLWKLESTGRKRSRHTDADENWGSESEEEEGKGGDDSDEEAENDRAESGVLSDDGLDPELDDLEILSDVSNEENIDMDQLRKYQLERLRYYYAIATFSTIPAAQLVHDELNGTEFERTANILDLSYVPEGMEFEESEVHDECTKEPKGYKGNEFVTDALRHSKVKLTWDQDDPNRAKMTRRALTRDEIEEEDFANLVAGSASDDSASEAEAEGEKGTAKVSKKERARERKEKLRALLEASDGDVWGKAGAAWQEELAELRDGKKDKGKGKGKNKKDAVEITFKPGLTNPAVTDEENMTSLQRYQMRMKEKKRAKKDKVKQGEDEAMGGDDFFGDDESDDAAPVSPKKGKKEKGKPKKDKEAKDDGEPNTVTFDADAAGLVDDPSRHFALKDLITAEKAEGKKRKRHRKKSTKELELGPEGFAASVDVADPRFAAIYDEPAFALDPTHSKYTDTSVNREILKRTREKHAEGREGKKASKAEEKGLSDLVASVKAKSRPRKRSRH